MKRNLLLLVVLLTSMLAMAQEKVTVFEVASNIAQPITVETGDGNFSVRDSYRFNGWTRVDGAYDANGNKIVVPIGHSKTTGSGSNRVQTTTYYFKTLYSHSDMNTSTGVNTSSEKDTYSDDEVSTAKVHMPYEHLQSQTTTSDSMYGTWYWSFSNPSIAFYCEYLMKIQPKEIVVKTFMNDEGEYREGTECFTILEFNKDDITAESQKDKDYQKYRGKTKCGKNIAYYRQTSIHHIRLVDGEINYYADIYDYLYDQNDNLIAKDFFMSVTNDKPIIYRKIPDQW